MDTAPIIINGKTFTAKEFLLSDYPDCLEAFGQFSVPGGKMLASAFQKILAKASNVPQEDAELCTLKEMKAASKIIQEVNGLMPTPKADEAGTPGGRPAIPSPTSAEFSAS